MTIDVTYPSDFYEGRMELNLKTDNYSRGLDFGGGEPEDNNLARDLNCALSIEKCL